MANTTNPNPAATVLANLPSNLPTQVVGNGSKAQPANVQQAVQALAAQPATVQGSNGQQVPNPAHLPTLLANMQAAQASPQATAQAVAVVALRAQGLPWAACGQAVGWGNPRKARSGAGAARSAAAAALAATRPATTPGTRGTSAAQAAMPLANRGSAQPGQAQPTQGQAQAASKAQAAQPAQASKGKGTRKRSA